jgi:hypothetical protein
MHFRDKLSLHQMAKRWDQEGVLVGRTTSPALLQLHDGF